MVCVIAEGVSSQSSLATHDLENKVAKVTGRIEVVLKSLPRTEVIPCLEVDCLQSRPKMGLLRVAD